MKRIFALLLAVLLLASLAACKKEATSTPETAGTTQAPTETTAPAETEAVQPPAEATITETVLVDQEGIKIVAEELAKSDDGYSLKLNIENNSGKNVLVSNGATYVNGCTVFSVLLSEVSDGKKAVASLDFYGEELEAYGFETIGQIDIAFAVTTMDFEEYLTTELITLETSAAGSVRFTPSADWQVLYEENDIRVLLVELVEEPDGLFTFPGLRLYIENNRADGVGIYIEEISVNDYMDETFTDVVLYPGTQSLSLMELYKLEENAIEKIETVEFTLCFYTPDTFYEEMLPSETVKVTF